MPGWGYDLQAEEAFFPPDAVVEAEIRNSSRSRQPSATRAASV